MLLNISLLEWVGYLGSIIVAVSLTMSSILKLRWFNLLGAAIFSFYGFAIGSLPVGLLNLFIVLADIYYLFKIYSINESIKSVSAELYDPYIQYFIDFHKKEISQFFPDYLTQTLKFNNTDNKPIVFLLLRNALVAGVFVAIQKGDKLTIHLDFVIPEYRDCKPGELLYKKDIQIFKKLGVSELQCDTLNAFHRKYLLKMGFELNKELNIFTKKI
jgi:hypothetical protein